jgi:uncharacterized lipoprotein
MTNRLLISFVPPAVALLLASCSTGPNCGNFHPYKNNVARGPIKAPAGVTVPLPDPAYKIPTAGTVAAPAVATAAANPCLVTPPSVLTSQDMAKPIQAPAAKPAAAVPAAATQAPAMPAPAAATKPPPVAGG